MCVSLLRSITTGLGACFLCITKTRAADALKPSLVTLNTCYAGLTVLSQTSLAHYLLLIAFSCDLHNVNHSPEMNHTHTALCMSKSVICIGYYQALSIHGGM